MSFLGVAVFVGLRNTEGTLIASIDKYVFNNITVIRSIACGNCLVYFNDEESIIPNIFKDAELREGSDILLGMYILKYFIVRRMDYLYYGQNMLGEPNIVEDFSHIFGKSIGEKVTGYLQYFMERGVLNYGIGDKNHKNKSYYLSPKGQEIWNMLAADSVLMELYREDFVRDCEHSDENEQSSYELMQKNLQTMIFLDLFHILEVLCKEECRMKKEANENLAQAKYISVFGNTALTEHLFEGVWKSVEYSGRSGDSDIEKAKIIFEENIRQLKIM